VNRRGDRPCSAYYAYPAGCRRRRLAHSRSPPRRLSRKRPGRNRKRPSERLARRAPARGSAESRSDPVARPRPSAARQSAPRTARRATAALDMCGKTETREPPRPVNCTERLRLSGCASPGSHKGGNMAGRLIVTLAAAALCLRGGAALAAAESRSSPANEKGTYFAIGAARQVRRARRGDQARSPAHAARRRTSSNLRYDPA